MCYRHSKESGFFFEISRIFKFYLNRSIQRMKVNFCFKF